VIALCERPTRVGPKTNDRIVDFWVRRADTQELIVVQTTASDTLPARVAGLPLHTVRLGDLAAASAWTYRFMRYKKNLDAVQRGVHPRPGQDFVFVTTIPAADGIDIVGAGRYVRASEGDDRTCEFAVTVAEDWRGIGLATRLLSSLMRRARLDGYETMEGWVITQNTPMLAVARKFHFKIEPVPGDATVLHVQLAL